MTETTLQEIRTMVHRLEEAMVLRLEQIETAIETSVARLAVKDWYTTAEAASLLGKAEFTVREWCRQGRVRARKQGSGRGKHLAWTVSHDELTRLRRDGLLPPRGGAGPRC